MIAAIEFCQQSFPTQDNCLAWLSQSTKFEYLLRMKDFKLRSQKKSMFLTSERRRVWAYYVNTHKYRSLNLERPVPTAVVVTAGDSTPFAPVDLPTLLPSTVEKNQKKDERDLAKKKKQQERKEKRREERTKRKELSAEEEIPNPSQDSVGTLPPSSAKKSKSKEKTLGST